jgi:hypothetical protein
VLGGPFLVCWAGRSWCAGRAVLDVLGGGPFC